MSTTPFGLSNQKQEVPVVQGTVVESPALASSNAFVSENSGVNYVSSPDFNGTKGEVQPRQFQDVGFAALFLGHLCIMAFLAVASAGVAGEDGGGYDYGGIALCAVVCGVFSVGLSTCALGFMMRFSTQLVKIALFFSIGVSLAMGIFGLVVGQPLMAAMGGLSFLFGCCYAYFVWGRIPFAAANLNTALSAVQANLGLAVVAYFFLFVAMGWTVWWSIAAGGAMYSMGSGVLFLFLVSYFWTHQVIQNTVHVTSAGVIGTWWFVPDEASTCCSSSVKDSFVRATTYSFGSICFGSLLVAIVQALRHLNRHLRDSDDFSFLVCIIDCILGCLESIIEYLNKWAYIYVGLYGYSYLEAGKNVMTLFQQKGWTTIITDDLVENVLFMASVAIGLLTGLVGLIMSGIDKNLFDGIGYENPGLVGFIIGLLVGFVLSSILMGVVGSAVNTVIVCFAEAPAEFQQNHPQLSSEMRGAWRQAWPAECANM